MNKDLTFTATMAATLMTLSFCSSPKNEWEDVVSDTDTAVCVDQEGRRVRDDDCQSTGPNRAARWYYMRRNSPVPLYGDSVHATRFGDAGSFEPRSGVQYYTAPPSTHLTRSEAVSRGGLGASGRRFGGGWS
jgi:hypothetical protein